MEMKQRKKCFWKQTFWKLPEKAVQRSKGDYSSVWNGFKEIPSLGDGSAHPCLEVSSRCFLEALLGEILPVSLPTKIFAWSNNLCYFWQMELENGQERMWHKFNNLILKTPWFQCWSFLVRALFFLLGQNNWISRGIFLLTN